MGLCSYVLSRFSCVLWTVACQTPLSMGFSRQEYWSGLPYCSEEYAFNPMIHIFHWLWKILCCCCSATKLCPTLWPHEPQHTAPPCSSHLPEFAHTHVHQVGDAIQPAHPLLPPFPPPLNHSQHQGLFQQVGSSYQVAKVLELQYQSFQWIFTVDLL